MSICRHCSLQFDPRSGLDEFCCSGCAYAYEFLQGSGLDRFYELRGEDGIAVGQMSHLSIERFDWIERTSRLIGGIYRAEIDIQGIHCAACIWLIEQLFGREAGAVQIRVNSSMGQATLAFSREFNIKGFLLTIARLGYMTAPVGQSGKSQMQGLLLRFAVCAALAMNSMVLSAAFYFGLTEGESPLIYSAFSWANLLLSSLCLWVGGSVFIKSAYIALKKRLIHLDLPIALGLVLGFVGSLVSFFSRDQNAVYFDTLNIFVTLMLLGRILQSRIIEHNRQLLLRDNTLGNLTIRKVSAGALSQIPAQELKKDDEILVVPGEVLPVDARLMSGQATLSLEWIQGESEPHVYVEQDLLPAGAFNTSSQAIRLVAGQDFADSNLIRLLSSSDKNAGAAGLLPTLSKYYSLGVLLLAALAFGVWIPVGFTEALSVTVALLVVTCPCAIGLATPLAMDLAIVRLRRLGVYVRNADFLSRLTQVKKIFFDKTGTLTLGELTLANPAMLEALNVEQRDALFQMASRSNHPKCRAVLGHLQGHLDPNVIVTEMPGQGMQMGEWQFTGELLKNGERVAGFEYEEVLKPDVLRELESLRAKGLEFFLLSGDARGKVLALAKRIGIDSEHTFGGQTPEQKAALIALKDRQDSLMIGDGINDALAFDASFCAGTPAVLHPALPARADFFLMGNGLGPITKIIDVAGYLKKMVRSNISFAFAYNVLAIVLAFAGVITPVFAAIFMPLSSLSIISWTVWAFKRAPV